MEDAKYVVIGAGVSGLSFANWVDSDDWLVLERDDSIGGYCKTIKQDGFVWDYSGHFFHFKHKDIEAYLVERMGGQEVRVVNKVSRIYHNGRMVDFPFQKNIHQLEKSEFIDCLHDLYFKPDRTPTSFKDMLYVKFGGAIAEKFLVPYNEKLYAVDLDALDVDAMGRFFPYADTAAIIKNFRAADNASYNATFTYPEGGAIQYVEALADGLDRTKVALSDAVTAIDLQARVVTTASGRKVRYQELVSSMPFPTLLSLCGRTPAPDAYSWNKVLVFNLGFDKKGLEGVHWVYFAGRDVVFYRIGFYDNIFDTDRMSLYVEIGYPRDAVIDEAEVNKQRAAVLADLAKVGVVDGHELVSDHHIVLDPAYVHITKTSDAAVAAEKAVLAAHGVHSIGRYGSWTYCSIEDNIVEARTLATKLST